MLGLAKQKKGNEEDMIQQGYNPWKIIMEVETHLFGRFGIYSLPWSMIISGSVGS